jgi:nucleoside-diphosphate-sugar epimerase
MQVLLTGATGYVGSAVLTALIERGDRVTALVRTSEGESRVVRAGALPLRAELRQVEVLAEAAAGVDAVVHTAWDRQGGSRTDELFAAAVLPRLSAAAVYVHTSDTWMYGDTGPRAATEASPSGRTAESAPHDQYGRARVDELVLQGLSTRARRYVVRPAPLIHGRGGNNLLPGMIAEARAAGAVTQVGAGDNRWGAVDVDDLAELYALLVHHRPMNGIYHAAAEDVPVADVMAAIARAAGARIRRVEPDAAGELGPMGAMLMMEHRIDATRAREAGWAPRRPGAIEDIGAGSYAVGAR